MNEINEINQIDKINQTTNVAATTDVFTTFLSKVLLFFIGLGSSILIARILGPSGKGTYTLLILIPSLVVSIGSLGVSEATVYFLSKKKYTPQEVLGSNLFLSILLGSSYFIIGYILKRLDLLPWKDVPEGLLTLSLVILPVWIFRIYIDGIFRGTKRIKYYNFLLVFHPILLFGFFTLFVWILKLGIPGAILSFVLAMTINAALGLHLAANIEKTGISLSFEFLRKAAVFGVKGHLGNMAHKFNLRLDQLLIGYWLGATPLGFYSLAVSLSELIWYIPDSIGVVLLPKLASTSNTSSAKITGKIFRNTIFATTFLSLILLFFGKPLISTLYGERFLLSFTPMCLLLPGVIFMSFSKVLSKYFTGIGQPLVNSYASFLTLVFTVLFCFLLIPKYGINGAALASSLAYAIHALWEIFYFLKISGYRFDTLFIFKQSDFDNLASLLKRIK